MEEEAPSPQPSENEQGPDSPQQQIQEEEKEPNQTLQTTQPVKQIEIVKKQTGNKPQFSNDQKKNEDGQEPETTELAPINQHPQMRAELKNSFGSLTKKMKKKSRKRNEQGKIEHELLKHKKIIDASQIQKESASIDEESKKQLKKLFFDSQQGKDDDNTLPFAKRPFDPMDPGLFSTVNQEWPDTVRFIGLNNMASSLITKQIDMNLLLKCTETKEIKRPQKPISPVAAHIKQGCKSNKEDAEEKEENWNDPLSDDLTRKKYKEMVASQTAALIAGFSKDHPEIMSFIQLDRANEGFVQLWSKVMLITFTYNFITCFWMLGFKEFPSGLWFAFEVIAEIALWTDFIISVTFPRWFAARWEGMYQLHTAGDSKLVQIIIRGLASFPYSILLAIVVRFDLKILASFWIGATRLLKLYHYRGFTNYFSENEVKASKQSAGLFNLLETLYNFVLFIHFMTILFIMPERFVDRGGWWEAQGYYEAVVPNWQKYIDSMTYCVSNMSGMGWGNIVPLTNSEYFVSCLVFATGFSAYLKFYSDILFLIEMQNQEFMENLEKLDQINYVAEVRHILPNLRTKVRYYFKSLRIPYQEIKARRELLNGLPISLQEEIAQLINDDVIQAVLWFEKAGQAFTRKLSRYLVPQIVLSNQYIEYQQGLAERMYFICEGVVEVLATDEKTLIRFMSKGSYFGEIGILLEPHKRSCSVVSRTNTLLYYVKADDMMELLVEAPEQMDQLKKVALARLKTTKPEDFTMNKEQERHMIDVQLQQLESCYTVFGKPQPDQEFQLPLLKTEFEQNMQQQNRLKGNMVKSYSIEHLQVDTMSGATCKSDEFEKSDKRRKFWHATDKSKNLPYFLIEVFSPLWILWNSIIFLVVAYDQAILLFSFAFDYELTGVFILIDIVCICLLTLDIFMRVKTAVTNPKRFCYDKDQVSDYYFNEWLILDVFAIFPFCYFLMIQSNINTRIIALSRLPRLLKIFRVIEIFQIFENNTDVKIQVYRIVELLLIFCLCGNFLACAFGWLGNYEYTRNRKFNGKCLFKYIENVSFSQDIIGKLSDLSKWKLYILMLYMGVGINGQCPYGDSLPLSPPEQVLATAAQIWTKIFLAYFNSQFASYIGTIYSAKANQVSRAVRVEAWMKQNSIADDVIQSYKDYEENFWDSFKGNDEEAILKELPRMLRYEVRLHSLKDIILNWEPLKDECQGVIFSILHYLRFVQYPKQEFVFQAGEIASEMYFIVTGTVEIRTPSKELVAGLAAGQSFGETVLLEGAPDKWKKHVYCQNMVCLAILKKAKFLKVAANYPFLKEKISLYVKRLKEERARANGHNQGIYGNDLSSIKKLESSQPSNLTDAKRVTSSATSEHAQIFTHLKLPYPPISNSQSPQNIVPRLHLEQVISEQQEEEGTERNLKHSSSSEMSSESGRSFQDAQNVEKFFEQKQEMDEQEEESQDTCYDKFKLVHKHVQRFLVFYNLVFIPLQFAFNIRFRSVFLVMEIVTIVVYLVEMGIRIYKYKRLKQLSQTPLEQVQDLKDQYLRSNRHRLSQEIRQQLVKLIVTSIAVIPFSLFLSLKNITTNFHFWVVFRSLRLIKVRPVRRFWNWAQTFNLNLITLIESVFFYYAAAHWMACYSIGMAIIKPDHRDTWLRRLPTPTTIIRDTPNVFDDLNYAQLYCNAMYYQVNTLSTLTLGDISAVTFKEKFLACINILIGCFVYNFLFANITTVVAFISEGSHIGFFRNYNNIVEKINKGKVAKSTIESASSFFYYVWDRHQGVSFEEVTDYLPASMSSKLSISLYQEAVERSLLFCTPEGNIDIPLIISTFKRIQFRTYRSSDLLIKIGEPWQHTFILIEGELRVYGQFKNELLGVLAQGSHFGLDLSEDANESKTIAAFDNRVKSNTVIEDPVDNLQNRSLVNLIANQFVTVAIIKKPERDEMYKTFPEFKRKMQYMNRVLFQLGLVSLERHTVQNRLAVSKQSLQQVMMDNLSSSTMDCYKQIIDDSLLSKQNNVDLSYFIKEISIKQFFIKKVYERNTAFKERVLVSHVMGTAFNSAGQITKKKKNKCQKLFEVERDSTISKVIKALHLVNVLYIVFSIPFTIAFQVRLGRTLQAIEILSLCISLIYVIMRFRIPVNKKGSDTREFQSVLKRYRNEGLIIDLFGLLPFNLIFGTLYSGNDLTMLQRNTISVFRMLRVLSVGRGLTLIEEFTVQLTSASYFIILIKAVAIWFNIGHIMGCAWFYLNTVIERDKSKTWFNQQSLAEKTMAEKYLRVYYFTLNIGTGTGTGDMLPQNELERLGFILFMLAGDVFFVFGFGLIIYFFSLQRGDSNEEVEQKIRQIHQLGSNKTQAEQQKRIQSYFAFLHYQKQNQFLIDRLELRRNLPVTIVEEVVIQTNEQILGHIIKDMQSENLVRELCLALKWEMYLPGDFVMSRGDIVNEVYFIADGSLFMLSEVAVEGEQFVNSKEKIVKILTKGEYFGEIEIVMSKKKRESSVQAATFCTLKRVSKRRIKKIAAVFPQLIKQFEQSAKDKEILLRRFGCIKDEKSEADSGSDSEKSSNLSSPLFQVLANKSVAEEDVIQFNTEETFNLFSITNNAKGKKVDQF